jgi:hypothetical protein
MRGRREERVGIKQQERERYMYGILMTVYKSSVNNSEYDFVCNT